MPEEANENEYQYAEDLPVEDHTTLEGSENFVMFDSESGKQLELNELVEYLNENLNIPPAPSNDGTYILRVVVSNGNPTYSWATE